MPHFDLGFAPEELLTAARTARAAYHDTEAEIRPYLESCGLTGAILPFHKADCEGFLYHDADSAIIAIRGSQNLGDWIYNANVELSPWEDRGSVHRGFHLAAEVCWGCIQDQIESIIGSKPLLITGHSLGGALALLTAVRLKALKHPGPIRVVTFGAPKPGDSTLAATVEQHLAGSVCQVLNQGDPVPWLPILNAEFATAGPGILFGTDGELRHRPPQWQAMLMLVGGLLSSPPDDILAFRPHSKEEYLRQAEAHFGGGE